MAEFDSGCHSVALDIVEPVSIELARDDSGVYILGLLFFQECADLAR